MGLDVAFHDEAGNEVLCLRNHWDFFSLFQPRQEDIRAPHDDFTVSVEMLEAVLEKIDAEIADAGAPLRTSPPSDGSGESTLDVPADFLDDAPDDWRAALPLYRVLVARLLDRAPGAGLVCGWSA